MLVYLVLYISTLSIAIKEFKDDGLEQKQVNHLSLFFLIALSIIAGIRYGIGVDYFAYLDMFSGINSFFDYSYLEPGFRLIISTLKFIGFPEISLFFLFGLLTIFLVLKGIRDNSRYFVLSVFIYIFVYYIGYVFNGMRQGLVMGIFIYLLKDIRERNLKKVLILSLVAMSIHFSAVFIILSYLVYKISVTYRVYIIAVLGGTLLILTNSYWSKLIVWMAPDLISDKISFYIENFGAGVDLLGITQRLLILCVFLFYFTRLKKSVEDFQGFFNIYVLGFLLYSLFSFQDMFATRINMFFKILEIILFSYVVSLDLKKKEKIIGYTVIILWATLIFMNDLRNPANFPFVTIFDK